MSGIPYNELQTINCTAKKGDGESATIAVLHYAFVIPCRDCKHYNDQDGEIGTCDLGLEDLDLLSIVEPDGFCAWGERREQ